MIGEPLMNTEHHDQQIREITLDWLANSDNKDTAVLRFHALEIIKAEELQVDELRKELETLRCSGQHMTCGRCENIRLTEKQKDESNGPR
jgi:hypothetical protein